MVVAVAATLEQSRVVKEDLAGRLGKHPAVNGVGVTRAREGWGVKVNLARPAPDLKLPREINGVPVWTDVVGRIAAR